MAWNVKNEVNEYNPYHVRNIGRKISGSTKKAEIESISPSNRRRTGDQRALRCRDVQNALCLAMSSVPIQIRLLRLVNEASYQRGSGAHHFTDVCFHVRL
jgi:hypothetical protein